MLKTLSLPRVFGVFFNQNNNDILASKELRTALNLAVDKKKIVDEILSGFGTELDSPLPPGVLGAVIAEKTEINREQDLKTARMLLEKTGWKFNEIEKVFEKPMTKSKTTDKNKQTATATKLELSLATSDLPELKQTAELLKKMWEDFGIKINLQIFESGDLNQNVIRPRKYDALLFGEVVGRNPDPFVFWHSSQRNDPGLNIAMYANVKVDKLLEDARTNSDETQRIEKYAKFQEEVLKDQPAIFLYSPSFIYLLPENLQGTEDLQSINIPSERFAQIYKWYTQTKKVWKAFVK